MVSQAAAALFLSALALSALPQQEVGTTVQQDAHEPHPWRALTAGEQALFDVGYAVFNTEWVPANTPAGRIDGLGPIFNSQSCDACHNSRRRGRGPHDAGEAPADLVIQLGRSSAAHTLIRGSDQYGLVLSPSAIQGFTPEGRVEIRYEPRLVALPDGTSVELQQPSYSVIELSGPQMTPDTVLMPRLPPSAQGVGLLEQIPQVELEQLTRLQRQDTADIRGRIAWLGTRPDRLIGRFGWQASEPTVASQVGVAFAREMGLTNPVVSASDCGPWNLSCRDAPTGGSPEVEPDLFAAVVAFERWHAVPVEQPVDPASVGARLFQSTGCADCHRLSVRTEAGVIHPYTDLLLHDMGLGLADRDLKGNAVVERWRTAPLWGLHAAYVTGRPVRLLHDGRARSMDEAILWHDAEAHRARENYKRLPKEQRQALAQWLASL